MKNAKTIQKVLLVVMALLLVSVSDFAQTTWVKAYNAYCYYHTNAGAVFTWNGGIRDGYCDGYGTVQWYNDGQPSGKFIGNVVNGKNEGYGTMYFSNGYIGYQGYWKNDMRNGSGTSYNSDGYVRFKGNFVDDQIENQELLESIADHLTGVIVDKIFDGGTNVRYSLVKAVYSSSGGLDEVRIKMMFNGNIVTDNYYQGTMVINLTKPYVDFVDYNSNFEAYAKIKVTTSLAKAIIDAVNQANN